MVPIQIIPFSLDTSDIISSVTERLNEVFGVKATTGNRSVNFEQTYSQDRNQYHSTELIRNLLKLYPDKKHKILGITSLDLFIPILTFVFGEAQLDGSVAVVSSWRLRPEFYGLPLDDNLLRERFTKESIHELGHTFGLIHCPFYECVMHSSTCVEEIDLKDYKFCAECKKIFQLKKNNHMLAATDIPALNLSNVITAVY
ncbi:MAG: archaemetzincin family Zn-dependent metalloprotease [Candidatus Glassbacteria bacterium]|nr:archaemetzincin family Zn-dependent metalloprotease [Candidatus Glassbacteria bacterium]